jgi:hypothetical protein
MDYYTLRSKGNSNNFQSGEITQGTLSTTIK